MKYILRYITTDDSVLLELESPSITDFEQTEFVQDIRKRLMEKLKQVAKAIWQFVSYLFGPQINHRKNNND